MRVIQPLFNFQYSERDDFAFSDGRLSIQQIDDWGTLPDLEIFSERDRQRIRSKRKALVADAADLNGTKEDSGLLLMAFRILAHENKLTPTVKYRLSTDENWCSRIDETEMHIKLAGYQYQTYEPADFPAIDATFMKLRAAEHVSNRLKNALFFVYRAFNSYHWSDGVLFYMGALEALFSLDKKGGATKAICGRSTNLVDDPNWPRNVIEDLYDVRSRITHGRLEAGRRPDDNLKLLAKMEILVKLCLRKLVTLDAFKHYATAAARDAFLSQFD